METLQRDYFAEIYHQKVWHSQDDDARCTNRFMIKESMNPAFVRKTRVARKASTCDEKYLLKDVWSPRDGDVRFEVTTTEYYTLSGAREAYFQMLWTSERLNSRAEGTLPVGEVSFGCDGYLCFIRNNVCIAIHIITRMENPSDTWLLGELAEAIDRQIISERK